MSKHFVGKVSADLKVGDLVHVTLSDDGEFLESPEVVFPQPEKEEQAIVADAGVVEAELPKEEHSEHVEST